NVQHYGYAHDAEYVGQIPHHFGSDSIRYVTTSIQVGTNITQAVGTAWAAKIRKEESVSLTYFGDGATSEGDFHAGMNFAGVFKAPTIFVCKNNQWAITVHVETQTAAKTLAEK